MSSQPPENDPSDRRTLERLVPELLRRVLETGTKNVTPESIRNMLGELKLSRESLNATFSQLDETKNGLTRALTREFRELLDRTSIGDELAKALSLLTLEVKMEVRFKPSNIAGPSKNAPIGAKLRVRRSDPPESEGSGSSRTSSEPPASESQEKK